MDTTQQHSPAHTIQGQIRTIRKGVGFVSDERFPDGVRIEGDDLNTALDGDTVEVCLRPAPKAKGGDARGEVVRVVKRARTRFVGIVEKEQGLFYLVPDDHRMYTDILIPAPPANLKENDKAVVELSDWNDPAKDPHGKVITVLGPKGDHEVEIASIVFEYNIDTRFPEEVERESEAVRDAWERDGAGYIKRAVAGGERRDFRGVPTFTIDPKTAKDFDDALSILAVGDEKLEIGIHIADVSHYVNIGSALDREAARRGFSSYLVDRTIPMLPEALSNDICSLNPDVDRLAFSTVFTLDKTGAIENEWFGRTVIHSDKRFSYEEAQDAIDGAADSPHREKLTALRDLADALREARFTEGSIDFDQQEVAVELDERGVPVRIYRKLRLETHKLVEEMMLLANRRIAQFLHGPEAGVSGVEQHALYRTHDTPDKEKLAALTDLVRGMGFTLGARGRATTVKDINALFAEIENTPLENLVKTAAIRSMAKAAYSTKNGSHFGLGFEFYTHFTSPIRRYADLLVHRLVAERLAKKHRAVVPPGETLDTIARELSEREIDIQRAERESLKIKQVEYMQARMRETFEGIITGVTEWGMYVEEKETGAEGLVSVRSLKDDFYRLEEKQHRLKGERTGKTYTLGDTVSVKVAGANPDRKQLDFALV